MPAVITEDIAFSGSERSRIGQNNDAFMVPSDERWVFMVDDPVQLKKGQSKLYDEACSESLFVPSGGEMWWRLVGGIISGQDAILRLREHHYDYLSMVHSYGWMEPENINFWMQTPITPQWLQENNLPVDDGYFDAAGLEKGTARRTAFEYIRDHLGYRFVLRKSELTAETEQGGELKLKFSVENTGFANPIPHTQGYIILECDGEYIKAPIELDCHKWRSCTVTDSELTIKLHRTNGDCDNLIFEEITSIEEAEKILHKNLFVEKDQKFLKNGEFFYSDLVGMTCEFDNGKSIGKVIKIEEYNSYATLRVKTTEKDVLIPFVKSFIKSVSLEEKKINEKTIVMFLILNLSSVIVTYCI